jgi:ATP-dependent Clp protease protease subunit
MAKPFAGPVKAAQSHLNINAADPYNPIMAGQSDIHGPVMRNGLSDLAQTDVFQRLLKERIIFLGTAIDETVANLVCSQLLLLSAEDHERDIHLYINSPGGSVTDGLAIYDTMQFVACDVRTTCVGLAASMGQFLLCAGAPGKRYALPHSRILMHQPSGQMQGQAADIAIQAEQIVYLKRMMAERIAFHTGQPIERIEADSDRDRWFTADEAKDYGFIDQVIEHASTKVGRI